MILVGSSARTLCLAGLVLACSIFQYRRALGPIQETPLPDYCGVGACSTTIPNRYLPASRLKNNGNDSQEWARSAEAALIGNPASPYAWADFAEVEFANGDLGKAQEGFRQALIAGPRNPNIRFRAFRVLPRQRY